LNHARTAAPSSPTFAAGSTSRGTYVARAPDSTWPAIVGRIRESSAPHARRRGIGLDPPPRDRAAAVAAAVLVAIGFGTVWMALRPATAWPVASLGGSIYVEGGRLRIARSSRSTGWKPVRPRAPPWRRANRPGRWNNSRVRLAGTGWFDHRLSLERGSIRATIFAPPRVFFVNTPSATAVDLGCAFSLAIDERGDTTLHVTSGWVALEDDRRQVFVPAGASAVTRAGSGPGTPYFDDAPPELVRALDRRRGVSAALDTRQACASARHADLVASTGEGPPAIAGASTIGSPRCRRHPRPSCASA
jgi:hypothetical protein